MTFRGEGLNSKGNIGSILHNASSQDYCQNIEYDTFLNLPPVSIYWAPKIPAGWGALECLILSISCKVPPSFRNQGDPECVLHSAARPRVMTIDINSLPTSFMQFCKLQLDTDLFINTLAAFLL